MKRKFKLRGADLNQRPPGYEPAVSREGTKVRARISHLGANFFAIEKVAHSPSDSGMGIAFLTIDPKGSTESVARERRKWARRDCLTENRRPFARHKE
jgi:hypothetical protein